MVLHGSRIASYFNTPAAIILFFFLVLFLNSFLGLLRRSWMLSRAELALVYIMWIVATAIPEWGFTSFLLPDITGVVYYASPENNWRELLLPHIPDWIIPFREFADVKDFYEGAPLGRGIPWGMWLTPLLYWLSFITAVYLAMISITVILRKQWVERERLVYPACAAAHRHDSGQRRAAGHHRSFLQESGDVGRLRRPRRPAEPQRPAPLLPPDPGGLPVRRRDSALPRFRARAPERELPDARLLLLRQQGDCLRPLFLLPAQHCRAGHPQHARGSGIRSAPGELQRLHRLHRRAPGLRRRHHARPVRPVDGPRPPAPGFRQGPFFCQRGRRLGGDPLLPGSRAPADRQPAVRRRLAVAVGGCPPGLRRSTCSSPSFSSSGSPAWSPKGGWPSSSPR